MGNLISKRKLCCYCSSDEKYYYNPLLEIHTIGKRNGQIICLNCFRKKNNTNIYTERFFKNGRTKK